MSLFTYKSINSDVPWLNFEETVSSSYIHHMYKKKRGRNKIHMNEKEKTTKVNHFSAQGKRN